jgi:hypothetical protein
MYRAITPRRLKLELGFTSLLTPDGYNPKTKKGGPEGTRLPSCISRRVHLSGFNVCPSASAGCLAGCLNTAGHGGIVKRGDTTNDVQRARIARTRWLFQDRAAFMTQLFGEIQTHVAEQSRTA